MVEKIKGQFVQIKTGLVKINSLPSTIKSLSRVASEPLSPKDGFVQVFSQKNVVSKKQILFALSHSLSSFDTSSNRLNLKALEFLLTVFACTQLDPAIDAADLKEGKNEVFLVAVYPSKKELSEIGKKAAKLLSFKPKKIGKRVVEKKEKSLQEFFGISSQEISTLKGRKFPLEDLVLEKIALSLLQ